MFRFWTSQNDNSLYKKISLVERFHNSFYAYVLSTHYTNFSKKEKSSKAKSVVSRHYCNNIMFDLTVNWWYRRVRMMLQIFILLNSITKIVFVLLFIWGSIDIVIGIYKLIIRFWKNESNDSIKKHYLRRGVLKIIFAILLMVAIVFIGNLLFPPRYEYLPQYK
jgi:hypothetical protein